MACMQCQYLKGGERVTLLGCLDGTIRVCTVNPVSCGKRIISHYDIKYLLFCKNAYCFHEMLLIFIIQWSFSLFPPEITRQWTIQHDSPVTALHLFSLQTNVIPPDFINQRKSWFLPWSATQALALWSSFCLHFTLMIFGICVCGCIKILVRLCVYDIAVCEKVHWLFYFVASLVCFETWRFLNQMTCNW